MAQITIQIPKAEEFIKVLKQAPERTVREMQTALRASALEVERHSKEESPVKTGRLRSSITTDIKPLEAVIAPKVDYAVYLHEGTRPHTIRPKSMKALSWKGAAHPVRSVFHPGTKANPFMQRGADKADSAINRHFERALENVVNFLAR